ncbi:hypothetical protein BGZ49_008353 [Haplosporangium sp. Z 27]|nr:hypothetical protein BGZ49_008353 [Haplosporangium sp. Z 27]
MTRLAFVLLAIAVSCIGVSKVQACESACRSDPVAFLSKRYQALLEDQANKLGFSDAETATRLLPQVTSRLQGRGNVIDRTIFDRFRGSCDGPGERDPEELCGSAKSIACFAPWGHEDSVFDSVHHAVVEAARKVYQNRGSEIKKFMVDGVADFCPENCQGWVEPFQDIMLAWEQREHPDEYPTTPNCLPFGKGGV